MLVAIGVGMSLAGVIVLAIEASMHSAYPLGRALVLVPLGVVLAVIGMVLAARGKRLEP